MIKPFSWKEIGDRFYYYDTETGKIVGFCSKHANSDVWFGIVYVGEYTFTIDTEKHLGLYVSFESAKAAVSHFWDISNRTLIE